MCDARESKGGAHHFMETTESTGLSGHVWRYNEENQMPMDQRPAKIDQRRAPCYAKLNKRKEMATL